ncbi:hypothetical protein HG530_014231 [Fusarium avenaceum]|nr:hypothetical protein HG530_014231 [Fusarium avenaceum]
MYYLLATTPWETVVLDEALSLREDAENLALFQHVGLHRLAPRVPLLKHASASFNNSQIGRGTTVGIFLLEDTAVFSEVLANRLLLLLGRSPGGDETARRIPLNICYTVVVGSVHSLKVGSKVLLSLGLLALKVEVEEVKVRALLVGNGGNNNKATTRAEERDSSLGGNSSDAHRLGCGNNGEPVTLGLPSEVDDGILDGIDNFNRNTLLLDAENLKCGGLRLLGLGVTVDLNTNVGGVGLPVKLSIANTEEVQGSDDLF